MTREEQIRQAGIEYTIGTRPICIGGGAFSNIVDEMNRSPAFEAGAKWADKTMLDKVYEWLGTYSELTGIDYEVIKESFDNHIKE